jgi:hypothetical protein
VNGGRRRSAGREDGLLTQARRRPPRRRSVGVPAGHPSALLQTVVLLQAGLFGVYALKEAPG